MLPLITLWEHFVLSPALNNITVPVSGRAALAVGAVFACFCFADEIRQALTVFRRLWGQSPALADAAEANMRINEAHAFLSGSGRVRSLSAACERFIQTLEHFAADRFSGASLPPCMEHALRGVLSSYRGVPLGAARYSALSRTTVALRGHRVSKSASIDLFEALLESYEDLVRQNVAPDGQALLCIAHQLGGKSMLTAHARSRLAATLAHYLRSLPEQYLPVRLLLGLLALKLLSAEDREFREIESTTLALAEQLPPGPVRTQAILHLREHASLTLYGRTILQTL